jgi:hypothetical protein
MITSERLHCGDVDDDKPARLGNSKHFGDGGVFVNRFEGIQHIERGDDIKGIGRKGDSRDTGAREPRASRLPADFETNGRQIEAVGAPELFKERQVIAGAAATIEDQGADAVFGRLTEQRRDEQSEAPKPEMSRFGTRGCAQQMLHRRNCSVSRIDT